MVSNIFESSNLSPKLPKVDLAKSIDTDASISESPSISFAIESSSECNSPTMEVDFPDVSDSTSKEDPSYSPDAVEILKSRNLSEEFYLPDIIKTYLVEFRKFLEGPECFLAKSKEIVAEVTLTDEEFKYLNIYVKDVRPQVSQKDNTVFLSWSGSSMTSGAISCQISSIWKKLGITESGDKNVSSNIIRKSASTEIREKNDPRTAETADLMAHSEKTAAIHYYVRKNQLNAAAGSTALQKVFEKTESTASYCKSPRKNWTDAEIKILKDIFSEEIDGILIFDVIKTKMKTVDIEASDRQIYDKLRSLKSQTMSRLQKVSSSSQECLQSKQEQNEKKV